MTRTWTVGFDGSDDARDALVWTAQLAAEGDDDVVPLVAWHVPLQFAGVAGRERHEADRTELAAMAREIGESAVETVRCAGASVGDVSVVEGYPAESLLERSSPSAPVVVGRRGAARRSLRILGSTASDLAHHARGPVVVVPPGTGVRLPAHVVVGFDGSDHAAGALRWALDIAPDGASIEALVAIDVIPWLRPELVMERHPDVVEAGRARIARAIDEIDPDRRCDRNFVLHSPYQALAESFERADLVVVGPRGVGAIARNLLGSVTSWLLRDAPVPIAIVPT